MEHFEDWAEKFTNEITADILEMMEDEPNVYSPQALSTVMNLLLIKLVGMHIYKALTISKGTKKKITPKEAYKLTTESFKTAKDELQDGIARAFEEAWSMSFNEDVEYYCQIKPVPEVQTDKLS